ncbi:VWA domain-containing protein [Mumia sp. zg.B21]|uniref:vWA domain-containing protein n=1 Tax=Mumia sp. zg.B21 TaxID=2855447 RepID=UPI001C6E6A66|nr:VWA domain-containing protein [Mumia sp. zg.B21]MBW9210619.1 VWA domain-containing protein [Mumia sp. zg.B21]
MSDVAIFAGFAKALREAGAGVTADRTRTFLEAVSLVGPDRRRDVYWAGRATLCAEPDDLATYDAVFASWFSAEEPRARTRSRQDRQVVVQAGLDEAPRGSAEAGDDQQVAMLASVTETLRHRDVASLSVGERAVVARMFEGLDVTVPRRRSPRRTPRRHGDLDPTRTLRDQLRRAGEPGPLRFRAPRRRPRRVVMLVDVSGSMSAYADSLLRLAHRLAAASPRQVEVFTLGTRLTRVTAAMRLRDPEDALTAAGATVPDWSGGTRLGEVLRAFVDRWGQRGMARGAVVVIASDGWERGDPVLLGDQVARLQRLAHRVLWANPHRGRAGYAPVQGGIAAVHPHLDALVAGHSVAAFQALLDEVGR